MDGSTLISPAGTILKNKKRLIMSYVIVNYIKNQQEHHKKISFKEEYMLFIKEMRLEFDERDWDR